MSGEQITAKELNATTSPRLLSKDSSKKVNINFLLTRVREEKSKERKENYIFLGLICGVIAITGIIASL